MALNEQDSQLLLDTLLTLASMQDRLTHHNVTIHKLRKLLGIEKSSEKQTDVTQKPKKPLLNKRPRPRASAADDGFTPVKPTVVIHPLTDINKGDNCPECVTGKIYKTEPGSFLRITGQSPFTEPSQDMISLSQFHYCICLLL